MMRNNFLRIKSSNTFSHIKLLKKWIIQKIFLKIKSSNAINQTIIKNY